MPRHSKGVGDVRRSVSLPRTRCRPHERQQAEEAARTEGRPLAEFIRLAVEDRARRALRRPAARS